MVVSDSIYLIIWVCVSWTILYVIHYMLKSALNVQYECFLHKWGISLSPGNIKFFSICLNRLFARCSKVHPKWQKRWFSAGTVFGLFTMFLSTCILLYRLIITFDNISSDAPSNNNAQLVMVLPGVNLPFSHVSFTTVYVRS